MYAKLKECLETARAEAEAIKDTEPVNKHRALLSRINQGLSYIAACEPVTPEEAGGEVINASAVPDSPEDPVAETDAQGASPDEVAETTTAT